MTDMSSEALARNARRRAAGGGADLLVRYGFFVLVAVVFVVFALMRPTFIAPGNIHSGRQELGALRLFQRARGVLPAPMVRRQAASGAGRDCWRPW